MEEKKNSKKGMGAFRLDHEVLDNLKKVSSETGIPSATIVSLCLQKEKVVSVVKALLEKSLSKFESLEK